MDVKSELHTNDKKSYLTYDPVSIAKSRLLRERTQKTWVISLDGNELCKTVRLRKAMKESLESDGFVVTETNELKYHGRNNFILTNGEKIPVTVRKITDKGVLKQIRVRITAKTHEDLMKKTYGIRDTLAAYGLKPKLCVWDRTGSI